MIIHDPWVAEYQGDRMGRLAGCDAAVVMVAHRAYKALDPATIKAVLRTPVLIDGRRIFDVARTVGLVCRTLEQGPAQK